MSVSRIKECLDFGIETNFSFNQVLIVNTSFLSNCQLYDILVYNEVCPVFNEKKKKKKKREKKGKSKSYYCTTCGSY